MNAWSGVGESLFLSGRKRRRKSWKRKRVREGVNASGMFDVNPVEGQNQHGVDEE